MNVKKSMLIICLMLIITIIPLTLADNVSTRENINADSWMKTFGGFYDDTGIEAQQTSDGGYIVVGETSKSFWIYENSDVWLIKTDDKGNMEWDQTFGGSEHDQGSYVMQTNDNGYIITGKTKSYSNGKTDAWLIKTDENGNKIWDKTFGYSDFDSGSEVIQTSDGGYIMVGNVNTSGGGLGDVWIIKVDSNGNKLWDKSFGGKGHNYGDSIQQTPDGGYIILGSSWIPDETNSYDVWLIKTDNNGEMLWDKKYHGTDSDHGWSLQQTSNGDFIVVGMTNSGDGSDNLWLFKTDNKGVMLWEKTFGGPGQNRGYSVRQTSDGGFIIAGDTHKNIRMEALLIKRDSNGEMEWSKTYGGLGNDIFFSVRQTDDGGYILTGYESTLRYSDLWLVKTDSEGNAPKKYNSNSIEKNDTNLVAELRPFRKIFPRVYPIMVFAQFDYGYMCYDESYEGGGTITFQIQRIFGGEKEIVHSESWEIMSERPGGGAGKLTEYRCSVDEGFFNIYQAKTILDVDDSDSSDNEASFMFIVIRS